MSNELKTSTTQPSSTPYQLRMCYRPTWAMSSRPRQHNPALHHTSCVCVIDPHEQWAQDLDNTTQLYTISAAYVLKTHMSNELKTSTTQPSSAPYQLRMCYRPTWAMSSRPRQHNRALHHTSCVCVIDPHEQWAQDLDNTTQLYTIPAAYVL